MKENKKILILQTSFKMYFNRINVKKYPTKIKKLKKSYDHQKFNKLDFFENVSS